jgi:hypothetical protein
MWLFDNLNSIIFYAEIGRILQDNFAKKVLHKKSTFCVKLNAPIFVCFVYLRDKIFTPFYMKKGAFF